MFKLQLCQLFPIVLWLGSTVHGANLKYVMAIWRHGDRAPSKLPYPLDVNEEDSWPRGWGMLTNLGMQQMHELGSVFRSRYVPDLLSSSYKPAEIYVKSSDSPRALSSAQSFLSGLFPPSESEQFDSNIRWQPVPVHATQPKGKDMLLRPSGFECPTYTDEMEHWEQQVESEVRTKYGDLLKYLGKETGYGDNITIAQAASVADIRLEREHRLPVPSWIHRVWPEYENSSTLDCVLEIKRVRRLGQFGTLALAHLRGGFLLGDWVRRVERVAGLRHEGLLEAEKAVLYSAHDGTLLALMNLMSVGDGELIPYASAVTLELHQESSGGSTVKLYYDKRDALTTESGKNTLARIQLRMECGLDCSAEEFVKTYGERGIYSKREMHEVCGSEFCLREMDVNCKETSATATTRSGVTAMTFVFIAYLLDLI